ncbi:MAG: hypothetical protein OXD54_18020 [Candidatus Poribacteria bacterium]|nr:hypothetical protein [Candidatus Poribacteria bacterium]
MNQNKVLRDLRARFDDSSIVNSCSGEGCNVYMDDIPPERVIVNLEREFDLQQKTEKRCDRLLFFIHPTDNNLYAVPIELKSGAARESDVIEKLENSLKFIAQIVPTPICSRIVYAPVLFEGRGIKWTNPKGTRQLRVTFRGSTLQILVGRCGRTRNLAGVLFG